MGDDKRSVGRPATAEEAIKRVWEEKAQVLRVVPPAAEVARLADLAPGSVRAAYKRLLEAGEIARTPGGIYYLPDGHDG